MEDLVPNIDRHGILPEVFELAAELDRHGEKAWIVGGCLRDLLLGREAIDWDLATTARPEKVQSVFRRTFPTGIAHGTVTVRWKGHSFEVTTLRGEGAYSDGRHPDSIYFVDDIVRDLERRDFTVNAMAYEVRTGRFVDPYGGLDDLAGRCIRAVRAPLERFREDGLRVLRAARFCATLEFELDPATEAAIAPSLDVLARVSHERVRDEWIKAMKARRPSRAFRIMRRTGILGVVAPALAEPTESDFERALGGVDAASDVVVRHAALLASLGGDEASIRRADRLLADLRYSNDERRGISVLIAHSAVPDRDGLDRTAVRRWLRGIGRAHLPRWVELAEASGHGDRWRASVDEEIAAGMVFEAKELRIRGDEVAPLVGGPGPAIRHALERLVQWVDEDPTRNDHDRLLEHLSVPVVEVPA